MTRFRLSNNFNLIFVVFVGKFGTSLSSKQDFPKNWCMRVHRWLYFLSIRAEWKSILREVMCLYSTARDAVAAAKNQFVCCLWDEIRNKLWNFSFAQLLFAGIQMLLGEMAQVAACALFEKRVTCTPLSYTFLFFFFWWTFIVSAIKIIIHTYPIEKQPFTNSPFIRIYIRI